MAVYAIRSQRMEPPVPLDAILRSILGCLSKGSDSHLIRDEPCHILKNSVLTELAKNIRSRRTLRCRHLFA
jgi:hypothetical protein